MDYRLLKWVAFILFVVAGFSFVFLFFFAFLADIFVSFSIFVGSLLLFNSPVILMWMFSSMLFRNDNKLANLVTIISILVLMYGLFCFGYSFSYVIPGVREQQMYDGLYMAVSAGSPSLILLAYLLYRIFTIPKKLSKYNNRLQ